METCQQDHASPRPDRISHSPGDQIDIGPVFNDYFLLRLVLDEIAKPVRSNLKDGFRPVLCIQS